MVEYKDVSSSSPVRTPKLQLTAEEPLTGEGWIPPKKYAHGQRQRRSLSKMIGGAKLHLESNPIHTRDIQRAQTKPCVHQETPQRLSRPAFECLSVSCGHMGQQRPAAGAGALVRQTWEWHKPTWRSCH